MADSIQNITDYQNSVCGRDANLSQTFKAGASVFENSSSKNIVQHMRHKSQGPMRSEKVYMMTELINQKVDQLQGEKAVVKEKYREIDRECDRIKSEILSKYAGLTNMKQEEDEKLKQCDKTLQELEVKESKTKQKYEKMI